MENDCKCDCYLPKILEKDEDRFFTCTDTNYNTQKCFLKKTSKKDIPKSIEEEKIKKINLLKKNIIQNINKLFELQAIDETECNIIKSYIKEVNTNEQNTK